MFVKYSDNKDEIGDPDAIGYLGQWSKETKKPNGRGIYINSSGIIRIGYLKNGYIAPGNFILICIDKLVVGEAYKDQTGKLKSRETRYFNDGRIEQRWWLIINHLTNLN